MVEVILYTISLLLCGIVSIVSLIEGDFTAGGIWLIIMWLVIINSTIKRLSKKHGY